MPGETYWVKELKGLGPFGGGGELDIVFVRRRREAWGEEVFYRMGKGWNGPHSC